MEANGKFKSLSFELFSMIGSNSIQSRGLVRYKGFPVKVYPFAEYFDKAYGTTEEALKEVSSLIANHSLVRRTVDSLPYLYGLAFGLILNMEDLLEM